MHERERCSESRLIPSQGIHSSESTKEKKSRHRSHGGETAVWRSRSHYCYFTTLFTTLCISTVVTADSMEEGAVAAEGLQVVRLQRQGRLLVLFWWSGLQRLLW